MPLTPKTRARLTKTWERGPELDNVFAARRALEAELGDDPIAKHPARLARLSDTEIAAVLGFLRTVHAHRRAHRAAFLLGYLEPERGRSREDRHVREALRVVLAEVNRRIAAHAAGLTVLRDAT